MQINREESVRRVREILERDNSKIAAAVGENLAEAITTGGRVFGGHFHFIIWCAHSKTESGYQEVTDADVIAATESEALARAQALCPGRKHYFIRQVVEHHDHHERESK